MGGIQLLASFDSFTLTWHYFFGQLVAGLTLGSLYALLALGYSMVYGILKLLNFAHGEVFMIGSYIGFFVLTALGGAASPDVPAVFLILLMFGAAMVGSALAGAGGVMNGLIFQNVNPYIGFNAGLKAFTAAVVGGIGSIPGAMFGGLAIGVAQAFATGYLSSAYQDVIVFAILVVFMLVRPSGLFGAPALQKV